MLLSLLKQSFKNQKKAMAIMVISVSMGVAVASSLITISLDIQGKVSRELRSFGANIVVEPAVDGFAGLAGQRRYLSEEDVVKAKTIFWRHNIIGIAPVLEAAASLGFNGNDRDVDVAGTWFSKRLPLPGEKNDFEAGVWTVLYWWEVDGETPGASTVLLGTSLAQELGVKTGDEITLAGQQFKVSGIISTGGKEDTMVVADLDELQTLLGLDEKVSRVYVGAITTPMDDFAYKDPTSMSPKEYEKWYCTGYVTSIAKQLEEVFKGSRAKPIWQVAETEGRILDRLTVLIYLISAFALGASALGVSTTMVASLLRRVHEIGVFKSIGADSARIGMIFLSEALIIGILGGIIGYLLSIAATDYIGLKVFDTELSRRSLLLPVSILSALGITVLGSLIPIHRALGIKPAVVLKGGV